MVHFIEKETKKSRRDEKCFKMKIVNIFLLKEMDDLEKKQDVPSEREG